MPTDEDYGASYLLGCCWPINHFSDSCLDNKVLTMTLDTNTYVISNPIGHFVAFVKALHASNPVLVEVDGDSSTGPHLDDGNAVILSKIKAIHSTEDEKYLLLAVFSDANAGVLFINSTHAVFVPRFECLLAQ